jgi:hypothetical protein
LFAHKIFGVKDFRQKKIPVTPCYKILLPAQSQILFLATPHAGIVAAFSLRNVAAAMNLIKNRYEL